MAEWTMTTTEEEIEAALDAARCATPEVDILEASYHAEAGFEFLMMKLSDGRRLLVPREELDELRDATLEQAQDLKILSPGAAVWWPQLDDGIELAEFLEHRWRAHQAIAA